MDTKTRLRDIMKQYNKPKIQIRTDIYPTLNSNHDIEDRSHFTKLNLMDFLMVCKSSSGYKDLVEVVTENYKKGS